MEINYKTSDAEETPRRHNDMCFMLQTNTNYSLAVGLPTSPVYVIERNSWDHDHSFL